MTPPKAAETADFVLGSRYLNGKVTVVGAGFYGSTTAQRLAEYDIFDQVVLTDIIEGIAAGATKATCGVPVSVHGSSGHGCRG